jgi:hypothetical protein
LRAIEVLFFAGAPTLVLALVLYGLRGQFRDNWRAVLFLAAACALFFHRILFFHEAISQSDANLLQVQFFSVYREAIASFGEIPFWNPHIGAGVPNLANPLSAMFYPLAPLFLLAGAFKAMSIFIVCHYFLAGTFALFLGRKVFRTRPAALAFAVLYAFNGWAMTRAAHQPAIEYLFAYTWLPLAALAFETAIEGRSILWGIVAGGAALAWMGMTCPNVFVYGSILLAAALAARIVTLLATKRTNAAGAAVGVAAGAVVFALALGAVEYGPARELAEFATGGRLGAEQPLGWRGQALSAWTMLKMYFPYVADRPFGVYYSPGALALIAALFGIYSALRGRSHRALAAGAGAVLAVGAALAAKTGLYGALARASSVFSLSSLMPAVLVLLVVPVTVLAAAGVEALVERRKQLAGWRGYGIVAAVFLELFIGFGIVYPRYGDRRLTFDYARETADFPHLDYIAEQGDAGRIVAESPSEGEILAPSYAILERGLSRLNLNQADFAPDWLMEAVNEATGKCDPAVLDVLGAGWVASTEDLARLDLKATVDWPGVKTHYEDNVYFPLRHHPGWLAWDGKVRLYRVTGTPEYVRAEPLGRRSVVQGLPETAIEELRDKPLGTFADWSRVTLVQESMNSIIVSLPETAPVRYFFAVTSYPGWRAFADGVEVRHASAGGAFMAAEVPQGTRAIEMRFEPTHWNAYMALAAAAVFVAVIAAGREHKLAQSA